MKKKIAVLLSKLFILYYSIKYGGRILFGCNIIVNHKLVIKGDGTLSIGDNVNLWAHKEANSFYFYNNNASITIGSETRLNGLTCHCEDKIIIGSNCLIGSTIIMDTDFHVFNEPDHILYGNPKSKPVIIGNHVWLCGQSVLLKGSKVGDYSVVGFRAVVTKRFPAHVVVAGNPARVVKQK